jgi:hypothetical protein
MYPKLVTNCAPSKGASTDAGAKANATKLAMDETTNSSHPMIFETRWLFSARKFMPRFIPTLANNPMLMPIAVLNPFLSSPDPESALHESALVFVIQVAASVSQL